MAAALLLAVSLLCAGLPGNAQAASFVDVPSGAWYHDAVYDLAGKGVVSGTSATEFSPGWNLTRASFAAMLARSVLSSSDLKQYAYKGNFKDVPESHWANRYVNWAQEAGVISGRGNQRFAPDDNVTRQEMAVMIANFSRATGRKMNPTVPEAAFSDKASISNFAVSSVRACQRAGVISGYQGAFRPLGLATRAEAASLYSRFLQKCQTGNYKIIRKRVNSVPVRAVEFDPSRYTADLILGQDMVDCGESASSLVKRSGAAIAVNAAFFNMSNYLPVGTMINQGRVVTLTDWFAPATPAITLDSSGRYAIQGFSTLITATLHKEDGTDSTLTSLGVNRWPKDSSDVNRYLFTRDWGKNLAFAAKDAVTLDENGTVISIDHGKDVLIPENGCVIAQRARRKNEGDFFDSCKVGSLVELQRVYKGAASQDIVLSIASGPRLVKNGAVYGGADTYAAEGFGDAAFTTYSALRVCIGIKKDGKLVIANAYATLPQLSKIMIQLGCTEVMNLDGGGSSNLYVDGQWLCGPQERRLNNMLIFR